MVAVLLNILPPNSNLHDSMSERRQPRGPPLTTERKVGGGPREI